MYGGYCCGVLVSAFGVWNSMVTVVPGVFLLVLLNVMFAPCSSAIHRTTQSPRPLAWFSDVMSALPRMMSFSFCGIPGPLSVTRS